MNLNGYLFFSLSGVFTLNNVTGELLKAKALDREVRDFYSLLVTAADQGEPPLMNQTTINITIVDVNDHIPAIHTQEVFSVLEVYLNVIFMQCKKREKRFSSLFKHRGNSPDIIRNGKDISVSSF